MVVNDTGTTPDLEDSAPAEPKARPWPLRLIGVLLATLLPWLTSVWMAASELPWRLEKFELPMVDFEVYRQAVVKLLTGESLFSVEGLPFIYPPFAGLLLTPFGLGGDIESRVVWLGLNAFAVTVLIYRMGLRGWRLSLAAAAATALCHPIFSTLSFGQINTLLMVLVAIDLFPGQRIFPRRLPLPGWLVGIAAAIKLTPAIAAVMTLIAGRMKVTIIAFCSFLAATVVTWLVLPDDSRRFWTEMVLDSSLNPAFLRNQSMSGTWTRAFGVESETVGVLVGFVIALAGLIVAAIWYRSGRRTLGVTLAGIAGLIASPISWDHHWVWVLPLGILLLQDKQLSTWLRLPGLLLVLYSSFSPYMRLSEELQVWQPWQLWVAGLQPVLAAITLAGAGVAWWWHTRATGAPLWPSKLVGEEDSR
ncbi:glycosyltransferase 87 family protein [Parenemella sanctibonifatiensis]|uniref:DUF2029 domain-containing protein n=1 Tax=Parenemella sanctibonifatiensis TaxID=2016505 RepID=A0A255E1A2_9ACTN|nr:glycosyltransferase 87 family protein [Parenemella sanctibonifatiensis]OYN85338.1 hypothetical protein CGZ92_11110 [Parenemella sanctibonifatiensis]